MSDAFAAAATVLFADPNLSVEAVYCSPGRRERTVRVIRRDLDVESDIGGAPTRSVGTTFEMLKSAAPERPTAGCALRIGHELWSIFDVQQNVRKGTWIMSAEQR